MLDLLRLLSPTGFGRPQDKKLLTLGGDRLHATTSRSQDAHCNTDPEAAAEDNAYSRLGQVNSCLANPRS